MLLFLNYANNARALYKLPVQRKQNAHVLGGHLLLNQYVLS
ncbi:hypothetical protein P20652_1236 [Pseudoalteromonas sp. BSi20652]|nr:hypothetical protein P20652_1236 [Pseudoalteromonas sp. BSi20652]